MLRERKQGRRVEVLVVHRPRHDDWSLPKGRRRSDETPLACALREVREETGLECRAGIELPPAPPELIELSGTGAPEQPNTEPTEYESALERMATGRKKKASEK